MYICMCLTILPCKLATLTAQSYWGPVPPCVLPHVLSQKLHKVLCDSKWPRCSSKKAGAFLLILAVISLPVQESAHRGRCGMGKGQGVGGLGLGRRCDLQHVVSNPLLGSDLSVQINEELCQQYNMCKSKLAYCSCWAYPEERGQMCPYPTVDLQQPKILPEIQWKLCQHCCIPMQGYR